MSTQHEDVVELVPTQVCKQSGPYGGFYQEVPVSYGCDAKHQEQLTCRGRRSPSFQCMVEPRLHRW
eukprot:1452863-Prorocentrum_lima.AAC.1